jgi:hypothetical protein
LHANVEFVTVAVNAKDGAVPFVGPVGPPVIVVSGTGGVGVGDGVGVAVGVGLGVGVGPAPRVDGPGVDAADVGGRGILDAQPPGAVGQLG